MIPSSVQEARTRTLELIARSRSSIPNNLLEPLPSYQTSPGIPAWHGFESDLSIHGHSIAQIFENYSELRRDDEIQHLIVDIACNRHAKRGRQNFITLLADPCCRKHAQAIASHLDDDFVCEQVIRTLIEMKAEQFVAEVHFLILHENARIRRQAELYCNQFTT